MKTLTTLIVSLFFLNSCVFESPFEAEAKIAVDEKLPGRWETVSDNAGENPERMLILKHSANEYVVGYPLGDKTMAFRAFPVKLEEKDYVQIQLIGTVDGPVKPEDRKYHLLKVHLDGDFMEIRTINPDILGENLKTTADMLAAFKNHKDDPKLFEEPQKFRRVK